MNLTTALYKILDAEPSAETLSPSTGVLFGYPFDRF